MRIQSNTHTAGGVLAPRYWYLWCAASVLPVAAVFHHAIFFPPTCMLNPFGEAYTLPVVSAWLSTDKSLPAALLFSLCVAIAGRRFSELSLLLIPAVLAFMPLAIWLWDIPGLARPICRHWHDEQVMLWWGPLKSRHFYFLGLLLWPALFAWLLKMRAGRRR